MLQKTKDILYIQMIKLFRKKKKELGWNDISLKKFYQIREILEVEDEYTAFNLIDCLYDVDSNNLPIKDLVNYPISFLREPLPKKDVKLVTDLTLNGREYTCDVNLTVVLTSQYIDFTNYLKEDSQRFEKALSVFVIPKGHTYNDGYNIREVQEDLLQLDIVTVQSLSFFILTQFRLFVQIFQLSLVENLNLTETERKQIEELLRQIPDLDFFHY